jgi:ribulose-5-phosphate 4-epimerase/fuculose-1-phosphate aldolase
MSSSEELMEKALKAWRFMYRRGFIEGFGHISFRVPGFRSVLFDASLART